MPGTLPDPDTPRTARRPAPARRTRRNGLRQAAAILVSAIATATAILAPALLAQAPTGTQAPPPRQQPNAPRRQPVDATLPVYAKAEGVSGSISSIGSDTMSNLMTYWAEQFNGFYPNVQIEVTGKGSGHAAPALIEGSALFGPMSRPMKGREVDKFETRFGYPPVQLEAAIDMLAVFVHKDNPIAAQGLTLEQLDAIFSSTRRGGLRPIDTWGDLGLTGAWSNQPISLYGRNSASGTYGFFKEKALFGGDFRNEVKEQPGSSSVISGIANDRYGIGYSGIGYNTPDVVPIPLARTRGATRIPAEPDKVERYPLARFLYVSVNHRPHTRLDPLRTEFIRLIYSRQGQAAALKAGFLPVPAMVAQRNLAAVDIPWPAPPAPSKNRNPETPR